MTATSNDNEWTACEILATIGLEIDGKNVGVLLREALEERDQWKASSNTWRKMYLAVVGDEEGQS